jgi:hypothetical protein
VSGTETNSLSNIVSGLWHGVRLPVEFSSRISLVPPVPVSWCLCLCCVNTEATGVGQIARNRFGPETGNDGLSFVGPKNTVLWGAFTEISIVDAIPDFVPCSCSTNRRFGDHIASIFRVLQLCCRGVTVDQAPHRGILYRAQEFCLL